MKPLTHANPDVVFDVNRVHEIKDIALNLFLSTLTIQSDGRPLDVDPADLLTDAGVYTSIMDLISDSGLVFFCDADDASDWWAKQRSRDIGLCEWLLQNSATFVITAFPSIDDYHKWCTHIASVYGLHSTLGEDVINVAIDTDLLERLAVLEDIDKLLRCNPWVCYLFTLQLSHHELMRDIYLAEYISDKKKAPAK